MNGPRIPPRSALVLAACALLILAFAPAQYFGRQEDDLMVFLAARALTLGRYCALTSPGCPAITMVSPVWPAMLAPLALFTEQPGPFQAAAALVLALTPVAVWAWLRRRVDEETAVLGAALFASCPLVLAQSGVLMTEVPFTALLLAGLAASRSRSAKTTGALGAALVLTRSAGLAVLPALAAPFAARKRPRSVLIVLLPATAGFAAWTLWGRARTGGLGKLSLAAATYAGAGWTAPLRAAARNALWYASETGGCFLPPRFLGGRLSLLLGAALAAAAAFGVLRALRTRRDDPAALALAGSALMLAFWGWQYERYLLPMIPLTVWALAQSLGRWTKPVLSGLLAMQLTAQTLPRLGRPGPWTRPELARTYAWLAAQPAPALLASTQPLRDSWYAGMAGTSLPDSPDAAGLAAVLKKDRVAFVLRVDGQDYGLSEDAASPLRRRVEELQGFLDDARFFRKLHEEPAERAAVFSPR